VKRPAYLEIKPARSILSAEEAGRLFAERSKRVADAVALRVPDRVPVAYSSTFWHAVFAGISHRQAMYDYEANAEATKQAIQYLQPDIASSGHNMVAIGPLLDLVGYHALDWPGHGVADDRPFQYRDKEYMTAAEYDDFLEDPSWFIFTKYLPRIASVCEPLATLPQLAGATSTRLAAVTTRAFADDKIVACIERLHQAGKEVMRMQEHGAALERDLVAMGFPPERGAQCNAPYDFFADFLRGSKGIMLDVFRRKEKLLAALDKVAPILLRSALKVAARSSTNIVFMAMHWGLDGFMSLEHFRTFFWPPLRRILIGLIDNGYVPMVFWEGHCESRLETIADIPRGKAIYYFEHTDMALAKQVLGDMVCIRGNVPASLLNTGTPDDVTAYCRKLFATVGKGGGFILSGATGIPDEAKPTNVLAMYDAARKYGQY